MRLELTGRHVDITPALRRLVEHKVGKLERVLNDSAVSAQAVLTREKHRHRTDITLHVRGEKFLHGVGDSASWEASLSVAIGKISQQAQKMKGKWQARKRHGGKVVPAARRAPRGRGRASRSVAPASRARMPRIVRSSRQTIKPMSVAEAAKEMDIARDGVVVFRDPATEGDQCPVSPAERRADAAWRLKRRRTARIVVSL